MKRLTIHTYTYKNELKNFIKTLTQNNLCTISIATSHAVKLTWANSKDFIETILFLLYNIAMLENPVYRYSPKLKNLASILQNTELHNTELTRLETFLKSNSELNLEGYVTFRMEEYSAKLDMILYEIIKKIKIVK